MVVIVVIFAVAAFSWALGVGFFLGYYAGVEKAPGSQDESNKFRSVIDALSTELKNVTASLRAAKEENARLDKRVAALTRHYLDQGERMRKLEPQVVQLGPQDLRGTPDERRRH